jgi:two-component system sensor histidine kinase CpxA
MSRLFWKLFLAMWLSIMAFSVANALFHAWWFKQNPPELFEYGQQERPQAFLARLESSLREGGPAAARQTLERLPRGWREQVLLLDANGEDLLGRTPQRGRPGISAGAQGRRVLVDNTGQQWELLLLRRPPPAALLQPGTRGIVHRLLLSALISALVSLLLARYLARPLESLTVASRGLAAGDLATRVAEPVSRRGDEFGVLAREFNSMADHLQASRQANQTLLRDVSHELRSPLARQRVALEIARNRGSGELSAELDRIELESERLETLVGEVLDLLRESSPGEDQPGVEFDLAVLLDDLQQLVTYELPAGVELIVDCPSPLPFIGHRELLWRALENLLRNALLHSGEHGEIKLLASRAADGETQIVVLDRGPGIPEASITRIFEPFYRVQEARDRNSGGHGLGLAIAAAAVRRHGGSISARNRSSGGLEMSVLLPARNA